jgi:hypothetical protein
METGTRGRRLLARSLLLALLALVVLVVPATASAAWQPAQLSGLPGKSFLLSVSCPSSSLCVAGGTNNLIASSTNPMGGSAAWDPVFVGEGPWPNSDTWTAQEISGLQIQAVSCPSARLCVAVMNKGFVYSTTNPAGPASAWKSVEVDEPGGRNIHLAGISCPTANLCVAVAERRVGGGSGGDTSANLAKVLVSTDPTGDASAWRTVELSEPFNFGAISCPRADLCVAVGQEGGVAFTTRPQGDASDWHVVGAPAGPGSMKAIGCVSTVLCVAGNESGNLITSTSPTGGLGAWKAFGGGGSVEVTAVSCPSASECLATDNNGSVLTSTNPTGGSAAWNYTNLIRYELPQGGSLQEGNGLFGASCTSRTFCVVTGARGQIFTSTDPFAAPPAAAKKGSKRGPRRPRAKIATVRLPSNRAVDEHRAKVLIRFFARGRNHGFVCKFDKRRYRRCHSPKRYRVGVGRHVFKVRAIGVTGLRGPVARAVIRITKPCPLGGRRLGARPKVCGSSVQK